MQHDPLEPLLRRQIDPITAVIDANVFGRSTWIRPIVRAAQDGLLIAVWSPLIICEVNRLLTWLWIKRNGSDTSESSRRRCSADFKKWHSNVAVHFHVVEDRPPLAEMWTDAPPDPWDAPIWTAAVRAREAFGARRLLVVTDNLKDGPPLNEAGLRDFAGITFMHPSDLTRGIARWVNLNLTGEQPPVDESQAESAQEGDFPSGGDLGFIVEEFLRSLGLTADEEEADEGRS